MRLSRSCRGVEGPPGVREAPDAPGKVSAMLRQRPGTGPGGSGTSPLLPDLAPERRRLVLWLRQEIAAGRYETAERLSRAVDEVLRILLEGEGLQTPGTFAFLDTSGTDLYDESLTWPIAWPGGWAGHAMDS